MARTLRVSHEFWQQQIVELATWTGWRHLHVRRSIGKGRKWITATNVRGWPDLLLWNPGQPGRHIAVELKVPPDVPTDEQMAVLGELARSGFEVYVWTPDDLEQAVSVLTRK